MSRAPLFVAFVLTLSSSAALAQYTISPADKFAWCENIGWMNFRHDAGPTPGAQSPSINGSFLAGFAWAENSGWINLGDGTPVNGVSYANTTGADFGVNINSMTGELTGLAWGENCGWINFSGGSLTTPPNPARLDVASLRFRGFAWAENLGWINLDDAMHFVGILCPADFNVDGEVDFNDYLDFVDALSTGAPAADFNRDTTIDFNDYLDFVDALSLGC